MEKEKQVWPTITIATTPMIRERLDYIRKYMGINSRSATVSLIVNEVYDRLTEKGLRSQVERDILSE